MFSKFRRFSSRFRRDERGAVAVIFGLALLPMMGMTGAAVDYNRASLARTAANSAADAAALSTVKATGTFEQRKLIGQKVLEANMPSGNGYGSYEVKIEQIMKDGVETGVKVKITGEINTSMLSIVGMPVIKFTSEAEATNGQNELIDVVFVLDTTDSMQGSRLATLKSSTTSLLGDFEARRGNVDQIRAAVVPFAQYVNIGMSNRNQPWLDVPADYQTPVVRTCQRVLETRRINCRTVWVPPDPGDPNRRCTVDGVSRPCPRPPRAGYNTQQCDTVRGPGMVDECHNTGGQWFRWTGCVGSRNWPNNTIDGNYGVKIPGLLNTNCGSPVQDWTTNLASVRGMINGLNTSGETYLPSGLIWGWRMLSTQIPFAGRSATAGKPVKRYMILVTDGQNTKSATFPRHDGNSTANANITTLEICRRMSWDEDSAIKLYTIAFEVNDATVKTLLNQCSTLNGGEFFDAANAAQLLSALKNIGGQMTNIRLTK
ncbi:MAG: pilus assembly protein TadG-related protein [Bosea sp. (in: a-proteobacteria)]|jgi:Flp pilus assembly protein TadG